MERAKESKKTQNRESSSASDHHFRNVVSFRIFSVLVLFINLLHIQIKSCQVLKILKITPESQNTLWHQAITSGLLSLLWSDIQCIQNPGCGHPSPSRVFGLPSLPRCTSTECICLNCKMYLSKLENVFVQIVKCIYPSPCRVFGLPSLPRCTSTECICLNCKMYLSKL